MLVLAEILPPASTPKGDKERSSNCSSEYEDMDAVSGLFLNHSVLKDPTKKVNSLLLQVEVVQKSLEFFAIVFDLIGYMNGTQILPPLQ